MEAWRTELYHHGIKGMKWGIRRFQNRDGSLTVSGRKRYTKGTRANTDYTARESKRVSQKTLSKGQIIMSSVLGSIGSTIISGIGATAAYKMGYEEVAKNLIYGGAVMDAVIVADTVSRLRNGNKKEGIR